MHHHAKAGLLLPPQVECKAQSFGPRSHQCRAAHWRTGPLPPQGVNDASVPVAKLYAFAVTTAPPIKGGIVNTRLLLRDAIQYPNLERAPCGCLAPTEATLVCWYPDPRQQLPAVARRTTLLSLQQRMLYCPKFVRDGWSEEPTRRSRLRNTCCPSLMGNCAPDATVAG